MFVILRKGIASVSFVGACRGGTPSDDWGDIVAYPEDSGVHVKDAGKDPYDAHVSDEDDSPPEADSDGGPHDADTGDANTEDANTEDATDGDLSDAAGDG